MPAGRIHIGTSGWTYDDWTGPFYPDGIAHEDLLSFYAGRFDTVELNSSFYGLPDRRTVQGWYDGTPAGFVFSCKASRYLTHMKKLTDPADGIARLTAALAPFGDKLGPVLFQLPGRWRANPGRLASFLQALPGEGRYAFEFRDRSWFSDAVYRVLKDHGAALCFYDFAGYRSPEKVTADFVYIRLHGPDTEPYVGSYDGRTLAARARRIRRWAAEGRDVFCYFDNDRDACAPRDAGRLIERTGSQTEGRV